MSEVAFSAPRFRIFRTRPIRHAEARPSWYIVDRELAVAYPMPNWRTAVTKAFSPEELNDAYPTNFPLKTLLENRQ